MPSRSIRTVLVALLLGAAVTGCGSSAADGGVPMSPFPGSTDEGPPPLPDSSLPATPALTPITVAPGRRERVAEWHLVGQSDGGRRLLLDVTIGGPPCDTVTGLDIAETATAVTITVQAGRLASAECPGGATAALATARLEARLAQPLGSRNLLGGID